MTDTIPALTIWQPYVAGVLHGDGWCTDLSLGLRVKDHDFCETFAEGVAQISEVRLTPKPDERGYWLVRASNRSGRFSGLRTYEPRDNDELGCWLKGLFDREGNAQLWHMRGNSYHRRVAIYSTAAETLARAAEYMDWLDIPHSLRPTTNSASHKGKKLVLELRVVRQDGFARFTEMVGSSIARKALALSAIVQSYQPAGWQRRNWERAIAARWGTI